MQFIPSSFHVENIVKCAIEIVSGYWVESTMYAKRNNVYPRIISHSPPGTIESGKLKVLKALLSNELD